MSLSPPIGNCDQGGIDDRALLHGHAVVLEVGLHRLKDLLSQDVLLQQVAERQDHGLIGNPVADHVDPRKTAHGGHLDQRLSRNHLLHLSQKLLALGALFGRGLLVIAEPEVLATHQPSVDLALRLHSRADRLGSPEFP